MNKLLLGIAATVIASAIIGGGILAMDLASSDAAQDVQIQSLRDTIKQGIKSQEEFQHEMKAILLRLDERLRTHEAAGR